jgi:hypothetical protein
MKKTASLRADFAAAVARLEEALALPKDAIVRDSAPRTCFRAAFKNAVIEDDLFWIELTALRNYTVHTYNESLADYVYSRLPETTRRFRAVLDATA